MQLVQSYYTTMRSARVMAGLSDTSSAVLCSLLRLSMASARLHLRSSVTLRDAILAVRMIEESLLVKSSEEPVLLLGRHMTDMVNEIYDNDKSLDFDSYIDTLADNFVPHSAHREE
jgi:DNA replicative helicase MCM subunit Mcm2 (Cdc46/Mcm family)